MWLMPSYGRPDALATLLDAPGGWPEMVYVLVNADDPTWPQYAKTIKNLNDGGWDHPWCLLQVPAGSRFAEAVRWAYNGETDRQFYGIIDDDYWPVTPDWHNTLAAAAGATKVAIANNKQNFPKPYCCRVMGGDLARAIGTIAPGKMRHNYSDDTWARFAYDFDLYVPLEDVIVEHRHHSFTEGVKKDATYERGSHDFAADTALYREWLNSDERREQCARVGMLLGRRVTATDLRGRHLGILVPVQDHEVDVAFHHSLLATARYLDSIGLTNSIWHSDGGSHVAKARERVLWKAMYGEGLLDDKPPVTDFLFIDADMGWNHELIVRLMCSGHDVCGAVGVRKQEKLAFCCNPFDPPVFHPVTGFMGVQHMGFAFTMIKRTVIEKLCASYVDLQYNTGSSPPEWALFLDILWKRFPNQLPERMSEDYSFCQRWKAIGGDIWIDPDAALIHAGRKLYTGAPRDVLIEVPVDAPKETA